ncbi:MAG: RluA family pseudouridine synthase [Verrucomicrobiota bacterium]|nr:RluA family pseudouridine synthase [Verrucomicrobiota bacterium]
MPPHSKAAGDISCVKTRTSLACVGAGVGGNLAKRCDVDGELSTGEAAPEPTVVTIDETLTSERLDRYLTTRLPHISRGGIQRLMRDGCILVEGKPAKPTQHPVAGQTVEVTWPVPREIEAKPEDIPLDILFEDADLVVVNKPAGIPTHPGHGHESGTLVNALLHHCAGSLSGIGGVVRPGIVHRLDLDTSGCLVAAKNDTAHLGLAAQFKEREVAKRYHAIVCGRLANDEGEIDAPIARHPVHRKLMAVQPGASRDARTSWRVLERLAGSTLVEATLHTGRTHQIRVHFRHIGFPLAGDALYGTKATAQLAGDTGVRPGRQMLHAQSLAFTHPRSGERLTFEAAWPSDFEQELDRLRGATTKTKP